mgnify:CR=1 FL=1
MKIKTGAEPAPSSFKTRNRTLLLIVYNNSEREKIRKSYSRKSALDWMTRESEFQFDQEFSMTYGKERALNTNLMIFRHKAPL